MSTDESSGGSVQSYRRQRLLWGLERCFDVPLSLILLSQRIICKIREVLQAERGCLYWCQPETHGEFVSATTRGTRSGTTYALSGLDQEQFESDIFQKSRGLLEEVASRGLLRQELIDSNLGERRAVLLYPMRIGLIAPLRHQGELTGSVYLDRKLRKGMFSESDQQLLQDLLLLVGSPLNRAAQAQGKPGS